MEFKVGAGLACVGIAVAIAQWLIPPNSVDYQIKFSLVLVAVLLCVIGVCLLAHATWQRFFGHTEISMNDLAQVARLFYPEIPWYRRLFRQSSSSSLPPKTKETSLDRFHNRRTIQLRIEFSDNYEFKHVGESTGHGIQQGHLQMYRVAIRNTTDRDIEDAQIWLTQIDPMPSQLMGNLPLPMHVTHEPDNISAIRLSGGERRMVDVVSFFDRYWACDINIHHTSPVVKTAVYQGDEAYEIELTAKGKDTPSSRRRFKIGVRGQDLFMESLDQSAEDAFQEGFDEPKT